MNDEPTSADELWKLAGKYINGDGVPKDAEKAHYYLTKAAEQGMASAQYIVGLDFSNGEGVKQDWEKSVYWYTKAAEQGNAEAQVQLGRCYCSGNGLKYNFEKAKYWFTKALEQNNDEAKDMLSHLEGIIKAEQDLIDIASKGDENYQSLLGLNYAEGNGAPKDPEKAVHWFEKAAEQGNAISQTELGVCYAEGFGVKQDFEKAQYWLTKAAEQDQQEAKDTLMDLPAYKKAAEQQSVYKENTDKDGSIIVPGTNLTSKLIWLKANVKSNSSYIVEVSADEKLRSRYQKFDFNYHCNVTVILKGKDTTRTISRSSQGCLFIVDAGKTLVLDNNITLKGLDNDRPLVGVFGNLVMNPGSAIIGNNNSKGSPPGGGVFVGESGVFTMNGGTISGNTDANNCGGGVAVAGTFIMKGGLITGNNSGLGGGVFAGGTCIMSGGKISGNNGEKLGGGVMIKKGSFIMNGGTISDNVTNGGGGGVLVGGTFKMSDGTISGNKAPSANGWGGGVYVFGSGTGELGGFFEKTGGTITGYADDTQNGNTVINSSGSADNGFGHAIVVIGKNEPGKYIDTTIGPTDNISFNSDNNTFTGSWNTLSNSSGSSEGSSAGKIIKWVLIGVGILVLIIMCANC
jgi:TPR repeat protein